MRRLLHLLVLRPLVRLVFGVHVEGREHLDGLDQYIIVANHNSHLDVLFLFALVPFGHLSRTHAVAASDYFRGRPVLFRLASYLFNAIWIDRETAHADPLAAMSAALGRGHNLVLFPEGTRGIPGEIGRFRTGIGRLSTAFRELPMVPVLLVGSEKAMPKDSAVPLPIHHTVLVGPPQVFRGDDKDTTAALERVIHDLAASETAHRHRRIPRRRDATVVAVLGIDGSGKSTLSRNLSLELSRRSRVCLITDEIEVYEDAGRKAVQPLLTEKVRHVLGRYAKTAGSLAKYKIPKLGEILLRDRLMDQVRRWYSPDCVVLDGSPLLNLVAWSRLYRGEALDRATCPAVLRVLTGRAGEVPPDDPAFSRFPELGVLQRLKLASLALPDVVLMLDVDPGVSISRIERRGVARQAHETEDKLGQLREAYLLVCEVTRTDVGLPVRVLDGDRDPGAILADALSAVGELRAARSSVVPERIDVVATTISGSIRDWGKVKRIVPLFAESGRGDVHLHAVDSHVLARETTRRRVERGTRTIISAGGSGTFNSVLEGCIDSGVPLSEITLGFLRKGSADLIGKTLGMPDEIGDAVRVFVSSLAEGRTAPCDVIEATGGGVGEGPRHLVGYGGTGIFGRIPHYTENRFIKYYKGVLSQLLGDLGPFFFGALLSSIESTARRIARSPVDWRVVVDGDAHPARRYQAMILVNGDLGRDLPFARGVALGSGDFHLFGLRDVGVLRLPGQFRRAWNASIMEQPERYGFESHRVAGSLELSPDSDRPFPVNVDGSTLLCTGCARFRIVDRINLISAR